jgi:hypothetical protein
MNSVDKNELITSLVVSLFQVKIYLTGLNFPFPIREMYQLHYGNLNDG